MNTRKIQKLRMLKRMGITTDIWGWLSPHVRYRYLADVQIGGTYDL